MAVKVPSVKRYVVRLETGERELLEASIRKGKAAAQMLLKARILLKADASDAGEGWSDSRIVEALETSVSMVYRVRRQLVEEGFEAVLARKALLSAMPEANLSKVLHDRGLPRLSVKTIGTTAALRDDLAKSRKRGMA